MFNNFFENQSIWNTLNTKNSVVEDHDIEPGIAEDHYQDVDGEDVAPEILIIAPHFCQNLAEMGSNFFGSLNQKSGSISISGIQSSNSCKKNHGKILIVAEVIRRLVTDTLEKTKIEIWPFMWLFGG